MQLFRPTPDRLEIGHDSSIVEFVPDEELLWFNIRKLDDRFDGNRVLAIEHRNREELGQWLAYIGDGVTSSNETSFISNDGPDTRVAAVAMSAAGLETARAWGEDSRANHANIPELLRKIGLAHASLDGVDEAIEDLHRADSEEVEDPSGATHILGDILGEYRESQARARHSVLDDALIAVDLIEEAYTDEGKALTEKARSVGLELPSDNTVLLLARHRSNSLLFELGYPPRIPLAAAHQLGTWMLDGIRNAFSTKSI